MKRIAHIVDGQCMGFIDAPDDDPRPLYTKEMAAEYESYQKTQNNRSKVEKEVMDMMIKEAAKMEGASQLVKDEASKLK